MDSPDYSDSEDSSSGASSTDGPSAPPSVRPNNTDLGKRVIFTSGNDKKPKFGVLRFCGDTLFSDGVWCGVELDQPMGKNNGSVQGIRYFTCNNNYGVFVPIQKVELDMSRRSRSRPNSQPSSRATSMERKDVPSKPATTPANSKTSAMTGNALSSSVNIKGISMQQELVNRLSQPRRSSHPANSGNRRQPMKAFATKGVESKPAKEEKKLAPFRTGGMYKAASSENIRGMKDKEKTKSGTGGAGGQKMSSGMPGRQKSSSERDLRNAGKSSGGGGGSSSAKKAVMKPTATEPPPPKPKWNQTRTSSCSDIMVLPPTPSSAVPSDPTGTTATTASSKSSTTSSSSHTSLEGFHWPRTSTPGNRDELTPDGCSSPEESVNCSSKVNKGFIETPDEAAILKLHPYQTTEHDGKEVGLANHVKRFTEAQGGSSSPPLGYQSVQSPDQHPQGQQRLYKNRPSGTATLDHPLITSIINDGENILKKLLGPNNSLNGVTGEEVARLFRQQAEKWQAAVVELEGKLEREQEEKKRLNEKLNERLTEAKKLHEAEVKGLTCKHQGEISTLVAAHRHALADRKGCPQL